MPADADARAAWSWWKAKKWVMHIAYRLFNRWGRRAGLGAGLRSLSPSAGRKVMPAGGAIGTRSTSPGRHAGRMGYP